MKKILLLVCCIVSVLSANAQWAVTDAPALAQAQKEFSQLRDQHKTLKEQKNKLDESLDLMRKVNGTISNLEAIRQLGIRQNELVKRCGDIIDKADKVSPDLYTKLPSTVGTILTNSRRMLKLTQTVLSSDLKMNDSERLQMLRKIDEDLKNEEAYVYKINRLIEENLRMRRLLKLDR